MSDTRLVGHVNRGCWPDLEHWPSLALCLTNVMRELCKKNYSEMACSMTTHAAQHFHSVQNSLELNTAIVNCTKASHAA